jgi:hypothetical protein
LGRMALMAERLRSACWRFSARRREAIAAVAIDWRREEMRWGTIAKMGSSSRSLDRSLDCRATTAPVLFLA